MPRDTFLDFPARKKSRKQQFNIVIVSSCIGSGYNIERPVTVDTAIRIDYLPCRGCTTVTLYARISRVAHTLLGNAPPRLSDTP